MQRRPNEKLSDPIPSLLTKTDRAEREQINSDNLGEEEVKKLREVYFGARFCLAEIIWPKGGFLPAA